MAPAWSSRTLWIVVGAGVVLGLAWLLSPVTVWMTLALWLILKAATHGRVGLERRLLLWVFGAALFVRVAMIVALFLSSHPERHVITSFPFDYDGAFMKARALWLRNLWMGLPIEPHAFEVTLGRYGRTSYVQVITFVQYLLGPAPYAIHLFNVCCCLTGAAMMHRVVRKSYGALAAMLVLVAILFMPSQLLWSASALKESYYFLLLAGVLFGVMTAARASGPERVAGVVVAAASAAAIGSVRSGGQLTVVAGLAAGFAGAYLSRRIYLLLCLTVLIIAAWPAGLGRVVERRALPQMVLAANIHIGNVNSEGHSYQLLDQRFYSGEPLDTMTVAEAGRFAVRAAFSFLVTPTPREMKSRSELALMPQQLIWYGLLIMAVPGVVAGFRRDLLLTWLLIGLTVAGGAVIALNSGNIGTLVRIRDSIVPFVMCLAAVGVVWLVARFKEARGTHGISG